MKEKPIVTVFASDDCGINIETLPSSNTIHHTYGICNQNISLCNREKIMHSCSSDSRSINLPASVKKQRVTNVKKSCIFILRNKNLEIRDH